MALYPKSFMPIPPRHRESGRGHIAEMLAITGSTMLAATFGAGAVAGVVLMLPGPGATRLDVSATTSGSSPAIPASVSASADGPSKTLDIAMEQKPPSAIPPARAVKTVPVSPEGAPAEADTAASDEGAASLILSAEPASVLPGDSSAFSEPETGPGAKAVQDTFDEVDQGFATASIPPTPVERPEGMPATAEPAKAAPSGQPGRIKSYVNMRASPDNDGKTLAILPQGARVSVLSCKGWCEIVYKGQRGFVFRKFLDGKG